MKFMYNSMDINEIAEELTKLGHNIRNIINVNVRKKNYIINITIETLFN